MKIEHGKDDEKQEYNYGSQEENIALM